MLAAPEGRHEEPIVAQFSPERAIGRAGAAADELRAARKLQSGFEQRFEQIVGKYAGFEQSSILRAGRDTLEMSAIANETRFRRVTDGNPCTFCAILATREDYRTAESAMYVVGRTKNGRKTGYLRSKGKRSIGSKFHDLCGCTVAEVLGEWEPSAKEQAYSDLYYDAVQACKDDGIPASPDNTSKMRELGEGVINDARKPETQTGSSGGNKGGRRQAPTHATVGRPRARRLPQNDRREPSTVQTIRMPPAGCC